MGGFCGLYEHHGGLVVLASLALVVCAAVAVWAIQKPAMPIHSFLYCVMNFRASFTTLDAERRKRFDDKAVHAAVAIGAVVALFNIVPYLGCGLWPGW